MKYDIKLTLAFDGIEADSEEEALAIIGAMDDWKKRTSGEPDRLVMECSVCHHDTIHGCICNTCEVESYIHTGSLLDTCDQQATVKHDGRFLCDDHYDLIVQIEAGEAL